MIGSILLLLGTIEGFTGYSLPDDLLSGTGLRAADGFIKATPVVGTYLSFFLFGGEFPGDSIIPRLYTVHVLLIPGLLLGADRRRTCCCWSSTSTRSGPGPGRTEQNVVGYPMLPVYMAKAGGFFFMVFGVVALMGGLLSINPVWKFGPYDPTKVTAGSQPDWYMGWPDGALPDHAQLGDDGLRPHDLLERAGPDPGPARRCCSPSCCCCRSSRPGSPATSASTTCSSDRATRRRGRRSWPRLMAVYGLFWAAGGNDIIATHLHMSLNSITYFMRAAVFIVPPIVFVVVRRWCIGLQRADNERLLHGYETGIIMRSPDGAYTERHLPVSDEEAFTLSSRQRDPVLVPAREIDGNGVARAGLAGRAGRGRVARGGVRRPGAAADRRPRSPRRDVTPRTCATWRRDSTIPPRGTSSTTTSCVTPMRCRCAAGRTPTTDGLGSRHERAGHRRPGPADGPDAAGDPGLGDQVRLPAATSYAVRAACLRPARRRPDRPGADAQGVGVAPRPGDRARGPAGRRRRSRPVGLRRAAAAAARTSRAA